MSHDTADGPCACGAWHTRVNNLTYRTRSQYATQHSFWTEVLVVALLTVGATWINHPHKALYPDLLMLALGVTKLD